jgi:hypothetical protein
MHLIAEAERQAQAESDNDSGTDGSGAERQPPHRKAAKAISPSDPASAWTAKANKRVQFGYGFRPPRLTTATGPSSTPYASSMPMRSRSRASSTTPSHRSNSPWPACRSW